MTDVALSSVAVPSTEITSPARPIAAPWSGSHRWAFRFVAVYFTLVALPFPLDAPPKTEWIDDAYDAVWHAVVQWVGAHLLHLTEPAVHRLTGSGDTAYNFVRQLCFLVIAAVATVVWGIVDRRRREYSTLNGWLRISLRWWVGWYLLSYGIIKVLHQQMPWMPERMLEPYGEFSPMGLLWTFMGYSRGYSAFAGALEMLGGLLLLFPRTASLGGLVVAAVMSNVVMMNFCFDVPVKLFSTQLMLAGLFIAAPDLGRLGRVLLGSGPVEPPIRPVLFRSRSTQWLARTAQVLMLVYALYSHGYEPIATRSQSDYAQRALAIETSGLYQVEAFEHAPVPDYRPAEKATADKPLAASAGRPPQNTPISPALFHANWARISISRWRIGVLFSDGAYQGFGLERENAQRVLTFRGPESAVIRYEKPDAEHLILEGDVGPEHVKAKVRRLEPDQFPLRQNGFRWVQEYPDNR